MVDQQISLLTSISADSKLASMILYQKSGRPVGAYSHSQVINSVVALQFEQVDTHAYQLKHARKSNSYLGKFTDTLCFGLVWFWHLGIKGLRDTISAGIAARDGFPTDPNDLESHFKLHRHVKVTIFSIFPFQVHMMMQLLIRSENAGQ
ncbi:putative alanine transaminase [Helianthus anomalus]